MVELDKKGVTEDDLGPDMFGGEMDVYDGTVLFENDTVEAVEDVAEGELWTVVGPGVVLFKLVPGNEGCNDDAGATVELEDATVGTSRLDGLVLLMLPFVGTADEGV